MTMHQKLWLYIIHDCHCFSSCVIWHHCLLAVFLCVHNFSNRKFYSCQIESYYFSPHSQMVFRVRKVGIEGILPNFDCFIQHLQFTNHLLKNSSEIMFSNLLAKRKIPRRAYYLLSSAAGINFSQVKHHQQLVSASQPLLDLPRTTQKPPRTRTSKVSVFGFCGRGSWSWRAEIHAGRVVLACQRSKAAVHYTGWEYVANSLPVIPHVP